MPNFDIDRIAGHRKTIEDNLRLLEKLRGRTLEDFLTDADAKDAAKYRLQTAIQAMIDITSHICARHGIGLLSDVLDGHRRAD